MLVVIHFDKDACIFIASVMSTKYNKPIYFADMVSPVLFRSGQDRTVPNDTSKRDQLSKKCHMGRAFLNDLNQR